MNAIQKSVSELSSKSVTNCLQICGELSSESVGDLLVNQKLVSASCLVGELSCSHMKYVFNLPSRSRSMSHDIDERYIIKAHLERLM